MINLKDLPVGTVLRLRIDSDTVHDAYSVSIHSIGQHYVKINVPCEVYNALSEDPNYLYTLAWTSPRGGDYTGTGVQLLPPIKFNGYVGVDINTQLFHKFVKRNFPRYAYTYECIVGCEGQESFGKFLDLSQSGGAFLTNLRLVVNDMIVVNLYNPETRQVTSYRGTVKNVSSVKLQEYRVGFQFVEIDNNLLNILMYVSQKLLE